MNISVVITSYNGRKMLEKHLPQVYAALRNGDEVIVVDDASTDDTIPFLSKQHPQVKIVKNKENKRYAETCNAGVDQAKNEIILLLNNDVSPDKDLLTHILPHFSDEHVFAVGCLERNGDGESGRSVAKFSRGMLMHRKAKFQRGKVTLWAAGGSMAVRKSALEKLGGMDRLYRPAYYEDIDLGYRAWKRGYTVVFEPRAMVHHLHETTNTTVFGKEQMEIMSYKNLFLFVWKNITDLPFIVQHILWLPYHLIIGGWRSHGRIVFGFSQALLQLGEVLQKRNTEAKFAARTDKKVLDVVNSI